MTDYSPWVQARRNEFADPRGTSINATFWGTTGGASTSQSLVTDMTGGIPTAVRTTRLAAGNVRLVDLKIGASMIPSTAYRILARVRSSVALSNVTLAHRPAVASSASSVTFASLTIPAGVSLIDITGTTHADAATDTAGFTLINNDATINATFDVTQILIEQAATSGALAWFDGDTANQELARYSWTSTKNASASIQETRSIVTSAHHPPTIKINGTQVECEFNATGNNVVVLDDLTISWGRDSLYEPTNPSELRLELIDPTGAYSSDPNLFGSKITVETDLGVLFRGKIDGITIVPETINDPNPAVPEDVWRVQIAASDVIAELARTVAPGYEFAAGDAQSIKIRDKYRQKYGSGFWNQWDSNSRRTEIANRMISIGITTAVETVDYATITPPGWTWNQWFREGFRRAGEDLYTLIRSVQMRADTPAHTNYLPGRDALVTGRFAKSAPVILTYRGNVIRAEIDPAAGYGFTVDCGSITIEADGVVSTVAHNIASLRITENPLVLTQEQITGSGGDGTVAFFNMANYDDVELNFTVTNAGPARTQYELDPVKVANVPAANNPGNVRSQAAADFATAIMPSVAAVNGKLMPPPFIFDFVANTYGSSLESALLATWTPQVPFMFPGARYEALIGWGPLFQLIGGELRFVQGWVVQAQFAPSPPDSAAGNLPINQLVTIDTPTFDQYAGSVNLSTLGIVTKGI